MTQGIQITCRFLQILTVSEINIKTQTSTYTLLPQEGHTDYGTVYYV